MSSKGEWCNLQTRCSIIKLPRGAYLLRASVTGMREVSRDEVGEEEQ